MGNDPQEADLSLNDAIEIIESFLNLEGVDNAPAARVWAASILPELKRAEDKGLSVSTSRVIVKILEAMVLIERKYGGKDRISPPVDKVEPF